MEIGIRKMEAVFPVLQLYLQQIYYKTGIIAFFSLAFHVK